MRARAVSILLALALWGCGGDGGGAPAATAALDVGTLSLMLPVLDVDTPQDDIDAIRPYLKPQDVFVFPPSEYALVVPVRQAIPGLTLGTGGTSASTLLPGIPSIPADVEIVTYDYEQGFCPEFSADPAVTTGYFRQLTDAAHAVGKKMYATPVLVQGGSWDWGEIARHVDGLVVQVQNFQTGANVPDPLKPENLGYTLAQVVDVVVAQVRAKAPATKVYLQFDVLVTDDPRNVIADIAAVKDRGIDGVTLWYNPGTSGATSKLPLLLEVLSGLARS